MTYNPNRHNRRSLRLKNYDYSRSGAYFITICCANRESRFGKVETGKMILNEFGVIANEEWVKLQERFLNFELDIFQIMPNHIHGIIILNDRHTADPSGAGFTPAQSEDGIGKGNKDEDKPGRATARVAPTGTNPTIGKIIGAYKSLVSNKCLEIYKSKNEIMGKLWQRNYWEIIIRNDRSYQNIASYIINNPKNWNEDKFFET